MKTPKWLLLLMALGATALLMSGCASIPDYAGDLVYYDSGCTWWWREGLGWRYVGFHGRGAAPEPRLHRPPPPGSLPPHQPGQPPPCYFFLGKSGTVLASLDGKSFRDVGSVDGVGFVPNISMLTSSHVAWYEGGFGGGGKMGAVGSSFHLASRPISGVRQFMSNAASVLSNSAATRGGWDLAGGGYSRSGSASGWAGGGSHSGGWSRNEGGGGGWSGGNGGGAGSFSHFSGGGSGGGGFGGGRSGGGGGGGGNHGR